MSQLQKVSDRIESSATSRPEWDSLHETLRLEFALLDAYEVAMERYSDQPIVPILTEMLRIHESAVKECRSIASDVGPVSVPDEGVESADYRSKIAECVELYGCDSVVSVLCGAEEDLLARYKELRHSESVDDSFADFIDNAIVPGIELNRRTLERML